MGKSPLQFLLDERTGGQVRRGHQVVPAFELKGIRDIPFPVPDQELARS